MEKEVNIKQSMAELIAQSDISFRNQFDPTSPDYHHGVLKPVPLGGDRVPETMPTMYPENYDPSKQTEIVDYGEEYKKVESNRTIYQNLKKSLAKLCPIVEAFLRHRENFHQKGDINNEKHKLTYEQNVEKENIALKSVQEELRNYIDLLSQISVEDKQDAKELEDIIHQSGKEYANKEALTDFNFKVKKLSTKMFSTAQKCLQKLKDIKKDYAKKQEVKNE